MKNVILSVLKGLLQEEGEGERERENWQYLISTTDVATTGRSE